MRKILIVCFLMLFLPNYAHASLIRYDITGEWIPKGLILLDMLIFIATQ